MNIARQYPIFAALLLGAAAAAADPAPVQTARLADIASYPQHAAPATVVSLNEARVATQVAGEVVAIEVLPGDGVQAGAVLARIDCRDHELALQRSRAALAALEARIDLAEKRLARASELRTRQSISAEAVDERASELTALQADRQAALANRAQASINVERCQVRAPYPALVTERLAAVGDYTMAGDPLLRVIDTSALEVSALLTTSRADSLAPGAEPRFVAAAKSWPLVLRTVVAAVDSSTRNREARLRFSDTAALPGTAGELQWQDPRPHLPAGLLVRRDGRHGIFLAVDGRARFQPLPEADPGRAVAVTLPADTRVITEGHLGLNDGQAISIVQTP